MKELTAEQKRSISNLARLGVDVKIVDGDTVLIQQNRLINKRMLTQEQLHSRGRAIFPLPYKIKPTVYAVDFSGITVEYVKEKMELYGIKRNDLIKQVGVNKSYLSLIFAEEGNERKISLSRAMKAALYYYFVSYELNEDIKNITK